MEVKIIKQISKLVIFCQLAFEGVIDRFLSFFYKRLMYSCGKNVSLKPSSSVIKGVENMIVGNSVRIARYATIFCSDSKLIIGNKVGIGPKVTIIAGNHVTNIVGKFMWDIKEKSPGFDKDIIIEDEIWVGANVIILTGVTIGRGSVIAAGSLVNKSCPPYSIIGGVPAKVIKFRLTEEEVLRHEMKLYPEEKRYDLIQIKDHRKKYI